MTLGGWGPGSEIAPEGGYWKFIKQGGGEPLMLSCSSAVGGCLCIFCGF